jgi:hypothetical protein
VFHERVPGGALDARAGNIIPPFGALRAGIGASRQ